MRRFWRFYDVEAGLLADRRIFCDGATATANTPAGYLPIPGDFDPLSQRVDITAQPPAPEIDPETGEPIAVDWYPPVIDYIPPKPDDTDLATFAWDAGIKRWVSTPTLLAVKQAATQRMAQAWDAARQAGVSIGGKTAPTDPDAWTRYLTLKAMAGDAGWVDVPIPLTDGTFELITPAKAAALWDALKGMERNLLVKLRGKVAQVQAAATAEEVEAIRWDA